MAARILIVEDNRAQRKILYKILGKLTDVEPYPAEDGLEAYALLKALGKVDLILMDHNMPYVKGLDFIKKLQITDHLRDIPVVVSSFETETEQFLKAGAKEVLTKPFNIEQLQGVVRKYSRA